MQPIYSHQLPPVHQPHGVPAELQQYEQRAQRRYNEIRTHWDAEMVTFAEPVRHDFARRLVRLTNELRPKFAQELQKEYGATAAQVQTAANLKAMIEARMQLLAPPKA